MPMFDVSLSGRDKAHKINFVGNISLAILVVVLVSIPLAADAPMAKNQNPNARRLKYKRGCLWRETKVRRIRTYSPNWVIVAKGTFASLADILSCLLQTGNVGTAREVNKRFFTIYRPTL
jgi:hypothetical protein